MSILVDRETLTPFRKSTGGRTKCLVIDEPGSTSVFIELTYLCTILSICNNGLDGNILVEPSSCKTVYQAELSVQQG